MENCLNGLNTGNVNCNEVMVLHERFCLVLMSLFILANPDKFHFSFINLFRLYIRLFLNSFGLQAAMSPVSVAHY